MSWLRRAVKKAAGGGKTRSGRKSAHGKRPADGRHRSSNVEKEIRHGGKKSRGDAPARVRSDEPEAKEDSVHIVERLLSLLKEREKEYHRKREELLSMIKNDSDNDEPKRNLKTLEAQWHRDSDEIHRKIREMKERG